MTARRSAALGAALLLVGVLLTSCSGAAAPSPTPGDLSSSPASEQPDAEQRDAEQPNAEPAPTTWRGPWTVVVLAAVGAAGLVVGVAVGAAGNRRRAATAGPPTVGPPTTGTSASGDAVGPATTSASRSSDAVGPATVLPTAAPDARPAPDRALVDGLLAVADLTDSAAVRAQVAATLREVGVVGLTAATGEPFDATRHHAVSAVPTSDPRRHLTIARLVRGGWESPTGVIRPADVEVARHRPEGD